MEEDHEIRVSPMPEVEKDEKDEEENRRSSSSSSHEEDKTENKQEYSSVPILADHLSDNKKKVKDDSSDSSSSDKEQEFKPEVYERRKTTQEKISSLSNYGIDISVSNPQLKSTTFRKHVLYTISGTDSIGGFHVQRRYKEFLALKKILTAEWPGCCIIQLPPKQAIVYFT